uniref:Transmembrane protein 231 n=1 Tax=Timema poppense TaxID=170557 RepID=A0A7R9GYR2_TIMPO|nr:unnamed protein product [Timema poppensis]
MRAGQTREQTIGGIKSEREQLAGQFEKERLTVDSHVHRNTSVEQNGGHVTRSKPIPRFLINQRELFCKMSVFHMESLGVVQHSSSLPGARLDVVADLRLIQKQLLYSRGRDSRFNTSVFDLTRLVPDAFNLQTLFKEYARRNVTTRLSNVYPLWTAGRAPDMPFIVSALVHYPEETIMYRPGFWQVIKWAWVQYLSVFIIFVFIFRLVKEYVFSNQLVFTVKTVPWKKLF